jgi:hypothetical protein
MLARLVEHKDIIIILMLHPRSIAIDIDDIHLPRHDSRVVPQAMMSLRFMWQYSRKKS